MRHGDFSWHGYQQEVILDTWKWGTRPIYRFCKHDTPTCRGIRYLQHDTRRETTKKFQYLNRIEGQIWRNYTDEEHATYAQMEMELQEARAEHLKELMKDPVNRDPIKTEDEDDDEEEDDDEDEEGENNDDDDEDENDVDET